MNIALIFAGGVGSRMEGAKLPKQFLELGGKPIIAHTIDHFENHPEIDAIVVVCVEDWISRFNEVAEQNHYKKIKAVVPGGASGQGSIYNGLRAIEDLGLAEDSIVLVHDGVRPLIDADTISACIESVRTRGCTATVAPAIETIIEVQAEGAAEAGEAPADSAAEGAGSAALGAGAGSVRRIVDRSCCRMARAPQGFRTAELLEAHRQAIGDDRTDFIDSISLMAHYGHPLFTVDGPSENIKITTPSDFFAFKGYTDRREMGQLWE